MHFNQVYNLLNTIFNPLPPLVSVSGLVHYSSPPHHLLLSFIFTYLSFWSRAPATVTAPCRCFVFFSPPYRLPSEGLRVVHTSRWSRWRSLSTANNETLAWMRYSTRLSKQNRSSCWWTNMSPTLRWRRKVSGCGGFQCKHMHIQNAHTCT